MKVTVEDLSSVKKTLHIEVPAEEVSEKLDEAYRNLKKTAKVKGFRPGKAPRSVLERLYGKEVNADVAAQLIQSTVMDAIRETELDVVGNPKVDPPELKSDGPYEFEAQVEVKPQIRDIDFKGFKLKKPLYKVSDQELDIQLKMIQKNMAKREKISEERPARMGDIVLLDYEGFRDGKPFEAAQKTENFVMKLGEAGIHQQFDEGVVGMQVGETKQISVTFDNEHPNSQLAGQTVDFQVTLREIRQEVLPEIDDELARSVGERFETLEDLKEQIRQNLQSGYDKRTEQEINEQIFSQLLDQADFEVPDALVEMELEHIIRDAERSFQYHNMTFDQVGLTIDKLREKYRDTALKQVRRQLILDKIIEQEKLELTDEQLDKGFQEMADTYNQPVDEIKAYYGNNQSGLNAFKHILLEKEAIKLIIDNSEIEEVEPEPETAGGDAAESGNEKEQ